MRGLAPFTSVGGRLELDGVDLAEVAESLEGRPAWVIAGSAVLSALARAQGRRRAVGIDVAAIGPPAVLALLAPTGAWASVASGHELALARRAGFPGRRIVVDAPVLDDGLILEALTARVGVLVRRGPREGAAVRRVAALMRLPLPPARGAPACVPASTFARCGGLIARLLAGPPRVVLDALWQPATPGRAQRATVAGPPIRVIPLQGHLGPPGRAASLSSLTTLRPVRARLLGPSARGDWVIVADPTSLAVRPPHPAWPQPRELLVHHGRWRRLDPRPMPTE